MGTDRDPFSSLNVADASVTCVSGISIRSVKPHGAARRYSDDAAHDRNFP
jgi:hypothetical protein